jgi:D-psicose/D-tagatose/L-ribulose 3-epimerase
MKFAVNALIWTTHFDQRNFSLLPRLRAHGFDGFEVPVFEPAKVDAKSIRAALSENDLQCTVCCILPAGMNPTSEDPLVRRKTQQHLVDCVKVSADLGSTLMAGPLYSPVGYLPGRRRNPDEWQWAAESFAALGETLDSHQITLALEPLNRFETYFLNTAADASKLCREINHPRVGVLLDTFHTNIEEKDVAASFRKVGKTLKHVHACENDRGIPGTGHVDFRSIFAALKGIGYDGWITIESFGYTHKELAAAAAIWRDLAPSPESIAFEGLPFLKNLVQVEALPPINHGKYSVQ